MEHSAYNRPAAVAYARRWALSRNPAFADFSNLGGDCTNFISQCLLAGGAPMRHPGWYYYSLSRRSPSWTSVTSLGNFLTKNQGSGPFGHEIAFEHLLPGDIIQLKFAENPAFSHSLFVLTPGQDPLIAAHSLDSLNRPLSSYTFEQARPIQIDIRH